LSKRHIEEPRPYTGAISQGALGVDGFAWITRYDNDISFKRIILHEIGHSIFDLADEYVEVELGDFPRYPNCAPNIQTAKQWWGDLMEYNEVGYFKGCSYTEDNIRPTENSIMRSYFRTNDFGLVNKRHIRRVLNKYE
jgi:hypothetical protein